MFIFRELSGRKSLIPLLAAANFLAALGGGTILRQGGQLLETGGFKHPTVGALLLGTSVGLGILTMIPRRWSRRITAFMSIGAAVTSLLLLVLVISHAAESPIDQNDSHAWAILVLLCLRFSFWFVARSLRTEMAASQEQKLAWVDLAYYSGMVLGLIAWRSNGAGGLLDFVIERLGGAGGVPEATELALAAAVLKRMLVADCCLQFTAGILDFFWSRTQLGADESKASSPIRLTQYDKHWYVRITAAIVFLTIGTQVVIFVFRGALNNIDPAGPSNLAPNVLATFYVAVSIGAFLYGSLKLRLVWRDDPGQAGFFGSLVLDNRLKGRSFATFSGAVAALLIAAIIVNLYRLEESRELSLVTGVGLLFCLGTAALLYEIIAAAILVRIAEKGKELNRKNMVAVTFGFMGVGAAISLVPLGLLVELVTDPKGVFPAKSIEEVLFSHYVLVVAVVLCFVLANLAMASSPRSAKKRINQP